MTASTNPNNAQWKDEPTIGYDPVNHQIVAFRATNITTDTSVTPNVTYGDLSTSATTQMASADGVAGTNVPEQAIGLYNGGANVDRWRGINGVGDAVTFGVAAVGLWVFNGASHDRLRTPSKVVTVAAVAVTAGTPVVIWTPTTGKKFHLMGWCLAPSVAGSIILKDTSTTEILRFSCAAGISINNPANFANGYTSTAADNKLYVDVTATGTVSGYVFGTEE